MSKKHFNVNELTTFINSFLLNSKDKEKDKRWGMIYVLEMVLTESGNYAGYVALTPEDMAHSKEGKYPGILIGTKHTCFLDETRRSYLLGK